MEQRRNGRSLEDYSGRMNINNRSTGRAGRFPPDAPASNTARMLARCCLRSHLPVLPRMEFPMRSIIAGALLASCILSANALAAEATTAFQMPLNVENWRADILGRNGMYRFRQVQGACQITFAQNLGADAAKAAGRTPRDTIEA